MAATASVAAFASASYASLACAGALVPVGASVGASCAGPAGRLRAVATRARSKSIVYMNRLLLEPAECTTRPDGQLVAELGPDDRRTLHVADVLRAADGSLLRAGVLDAGATDVAVARWIGHRASSKPSLELNMGPAARLLQPLDLAARPQVDLVLAMPRPLALGRLIPVIASMGVGTLWITGTLWIPGARRVDKSYFASHLLKVGNEAALRAALIEGLEQAGDTAVPRVIVRRNLKRLLSEELAAAGAQPCVKLVCHPQRENEPMALRLGELPPVPHGSRLLLAVGPEGGWDEPGELDTFGQHGFEQVTLGPRTLRTETATIALLALAHDRLQRRA